MLHFQLVQDGPPRGIVLVLHGLLGSGSNWRSLARRLCAGRPDLGVALVDLREHGASQAQPPPHTLASAAADLLELAPHLPAPVVGVIGHSFGGKVALRSLPRCPPSLRAAFIIDSTPSARPQARGSEGVLLVLRALRAPGVIAPHPSRESFVAALGAQGVSAPTAQWLAMNLRGAPGDYRFALDLDAIDALLSDYLRTDLWDLLESPPVPVHLIVGGRSAVVDAADRERALALTARGAPVHLHVLPAAGHDVHVDDPEGLLLLLRAGLPPL